MLSPETLATYKRMTPGERLRLTLDLSRSAWQALLEGSPDIVQRRVERLRRENDLRNERIIACLEKSGRTLPCSESK